jgi:hypothetical protein
VIINQYQPRDIARDGLVERDRGERSPSDLGRSAWIAFKALTTARAGVLATWQPGMLSLVQAVEAGSASSSAAQGS